MSRLNKTDKVDSEVLARFAMTADLHFWQPLPKHIQLLNALLERRAVLYEDLQREKNRLEKAKSTFTMEPVLESLHKSIAQLNKHIQNIDQQIDNHIDQNPDLKNDKELLSSIPAIADRTSLLMLSFLRSHTFEKKLVKQQPLSAWFQFKSNRVAPFVVEAAYLKQALPKYVLVYIWQPLSQLDITLISKK